jgi:hypothetical protein
MLKTLPANPIRGLIGLCAIALMTIGAGLLWGWGGAFFTLGLFLAIDTSSDEAVERITLTKRDHKL